MSFPDLPSNAEIRFSPATRPQVTEENFQADTVEEAFQAVTPDPPTTIRQTFEAISRLVGGSVFQASLSPDADTVLSHSLSRVPNVVLLSVATDGYPGWAYGVPAGGPPDTTVSTGVGTLEVNTEAWSRTQVVLRATREATYVVVVI